MEDQFREQIDDDAPADEMKNVGTLVIAATAEEWGTDEYVINAATVEGDTLSVNVSYDGGCETHQFTLVAAPMFLESFPVQLRVYLAHNANGDTCEEALTEDYHFDLTPIKQVYQKGYQTDEGTIILRLKDAPPGTIAYEF